MPRVVISDTSCFIILIKINQLDLLKKVYGFVITTSEILNELGETLPDWVEIKNPSDPIRQLLLESMVDKGEASAISLALEFPGSTLIIDDYKARRTAENAGLIVTGTFGVIIKAKKMGLISSVRHMLLEISLTDFRISDELVKIVLKEAGEENA